MSKFITKEAAEKLAKLALAGKLEAIEALEKERADFIRKKAEALIPEKVKKAYAACTTEKERSYFNTEVYVKTIYGTKSYDYINVRFDSRILTSDTVGVKLTKAEADKWYYRIKKLKEACNADVRTVKNNLLALKTYANIAKQLPEMVQYMRAAEVGAESISPELQKVKALLKK